MRPLAWAPAAGGPLHCTVRGCGSEAPGCVDRTNPWVPAWRVPPAGRSVAPHTPGVSPRPHFGQGLGLDTCRQDSGAGEPAGERPWETPASPSWHVSPGAPPRAQLTGSQGGESAPGPWGMRNLPARTTALCRWRRQPRSPGVRRVQSAGAVGSSRWIAALAGSILGAGAVGPQPSGSLDPTCPPALGPQSCSGAASWLILALQEFPPSSLLVHWVGVPRTAVTADPLWPPVFGVLSRVADWPACSVMGREAPTSLLGPHAGLGG